MSEGALAFGRPVTAAGVPELEGPAPKEEDAPPAREPGWGAAVGAPARG